MFNVVGIVARPDRKKALEYAVKLLTYMESKGLKVFLEPKLAKYANRQSEALPLESMKVDWIITIGGDGTILRTCLLIPKPEPPILAINMGVRGFLTEVNPKEGIEAINKCLDGKFTLERFMKLASLIGKDRRLPDALNEVFITSRALAKTLYAKIWKDGQLVAKCRSDGIVVASQAGATGYSLSAGGPILDPEVNAFVLTPVCPISAFHPIVFSAKSTVSVELLKPKSATVVIDGHYQAELNRKKHRITITMSENESTFVRLKSDFYRRLKGRLLFSRGKEL
jgi:NAD+ kinase